MVGGPPRYTRPVIVPRYTVHERAFVFQVNFLIKQLVVNSKKIGGSAAGQTKRIEKDRSSLVSF